MRDDALCSLRPIAVSEAVRAHLRGVLMSSPPAGFERFVRDIAAPNAKMAAHCGRPAARW